MLLVVVVVRHGETLDLLFFFLLLLLASVPEEPTILPERILIEMQLTEKLPCSGGRCVARSCDRGVDLELS